MRDISHASIYSRRMIAVLFVSTAAVCVMRTARQCAERIGLNIALYLSLRQIIISVHASREQQQHHHQGGLHRNFSARQTQTLHDVLGRCISGGHVVGTAAYGQWRHWTVLEAANRVDASRQKRPTAKSEGTEPQPL